MNSMGTGIYKRKTRNFTELGKVGISGSRDVIISACDDGSFTIAQRVTLDEGNGEMSIFLKGAIHVESRGHLRGLCDMLNDVLYKLG